MCVMKKEKTTYVALFHTWLHCWSSSSSSCCSGSISEFAHAVVLLLHNEHFFLHHSNSLSALLPSMTSLSDTVFISNCMRFIIFTFILLSLFHFEQLTSHVSQYGNKGGFSVVPKQHFVVIQQHLVVPDGVYQYILLLFNVSHVQPNN